MNWTKFRQIKEDTGIGPSEKLILIYLLDHQNGDNAAFPTLATLSSSTNLARTTISGITSRLEMDGKLAKKRRQGSSLYIVLPTPEERAEFGIPELSVQDTRTQCLDIPNTVFRYPETETPIEPPIETPTETKPLAATPQPPANFQGWIETLREAKDNKSKLVAILAHAYSTLYPQLGPPDYAMIGTTAKRMKSASRVMEFLWELSMRPPNVMDCSGLMIYIQGVVKRRKDGQPASRTEEPTDDEATRQREELRAWKEEQRHGSERSEVAEDSGPEAAGPANH